MLKLFFEKIVTFDRLVRRTGRFRELTRIEVDLCRRGPRFENHPKIEFFMTRKRFRVDLLDGDTLEST